jgi:hypothetical protein
VRSSWRLLTQVHHLLNDSRRHGDLRPGTRGGIAAHTGGTAHRIPILPAIDRPLAFCPTSKNCHLADAVADNSTIRARHTNFCGVLRSLLPTLQPRPFLRWYPEACLRLLHASKLASLDRPASPFANCQEPSADRLSIGEVALRIEAVFGENLFHHVVPPDFGKTLIKGGT